MIGLARWLAIEWAARGIRVNGISPAHFRRPLVEAAIAKDSRNADYFLHNIPLGRLGVPSDIVGAAIFLASAASSMVTGHILNVDGGHTAVRRGNTIKLKTSGPTAGHLLHATNTPTDTGVR